MKFSSLKSLKEKHININLLDGGLDTSKSPLNIDNNCLTLGKNIVSDGHTLKTRPAIFTDSSKIIESELSQYSDYSTYQITDSKIFIEGICYRLATEYIEYGFSDYYVAIYLIDQEGTPTYTGAIHYTRSSDSLFYIPTNITFYQGKAQNGGGIFALVSLNNMEDYSSKHFEIYEINSSLSAWDRTDTYYVPTVYINGRGDSYEKAEASNQTFTEKPRILESPNLLNGKFYAYFSSDGYSSAFRLPFSALDNQNITCRIYRTPTEYTEWTVTAGNTTNVQSILGVNVTINVDRSKGMFYFTVPAGDYSVPLMNKYKVNNIKVTAFKNIADGFRDVVSCTQCISMNSRIVLSGGIKNNRIYYAKYETPLYFPQIDSNEIGEARLPVTAFCQIKNKILALKNNECFLIEIKNGKAINSISLLADNDTYFYENDSFKITTLSLNIGILNRNAVTAVGDKALLFGDDGNIYSISASGEIKNIGSKIKSVLEQIPDYMRKNAVVLSSAKYCIFAFESYAITACFRNGKYDIENIGWYFWEFPEEMRITGGFSSDISPIILCREAPNTGFCSVLNGDTDILINNYSSDRIQKYKINSSITTKHLSGDSVNLKKQLNKLYLQLNSKGHTIIAVNGKKVKFLSDNLKSSKGMRKVTVFPSNSHFNSVYITLDSDTYFELGEIDIFYKELLN